jgi:hypothetical protein
MPFPRLGLRVATVMVMLVTGDRLSRGTSPCRSYVPVELTGTLVEVTRDGSPVPSDDPIFSVVPRVVCMAPVNGTPGDRSIAMSDCYDSRFQAVFQMETP